MKLLIVSSVIAALAAGSAVAADMAHGKVVFEQCSACHSLNPAKNDPGPNLKGIVGRKAAMVDDYIYSTAMKRSAITWDAQTLNAYLAEPSVVVPRNKMPYAGMANPQDRTDLIAWLKTQ